MPSRFRGILSSRSRGGASEDTRATGSNMANVPETEPQRPTLLTTDRKNELLYEGVMLQATMMNDEAQGDFKVFQFKDLIERGWSIVPPLSPNLHEISFLEGLAGVKWFLDDDIEKGAPVSLADPNEWFERNDLYQRVSPPPHHYAGS